MSIDSMTDLSPLDEGSSVLTGNTNKDEDDCYGKRKTQARFSGKA